MAIMFRKRFSFRRTFICWVVLLILIITMAAPLLKRNVRLTGHLSTPSPVLGSSDNSPVGKKTKLNSPPEDQRGDLKTTTDHSSSKQTNWTSTLSYRKYLVNLTDSWEYDHYLKVMLGSQNGCQEAGSYDAVMAVHTAPSNAAKRQAIRWLYTDSKKTYPYRIKVVFFIGLVINVKLHSQLVNESKQFGDMVQGKFIDSYRNLTYKAMFVYKWVSDHCRGLKVLLRTDDDVYLDVKHFFQAWDRLVSTKTNTIMCDVVHKDIVWRVGKWAVKRSEIAEDKYQFQHCRGYFSALTSDLPGKMVETGRRTPFFWIDDVFVYGFVAAKVGVVFVNVDRLMARWNEAKFTKCYEAQGRNCSLLSVLATPDKFSRLYSITHGNASMTIGHLDN